MSDIYEEEMFRELEMQLEWEYYQRRIKLAKAFVEKQQLEFGFGSKRQWLVVFVVEEHDIKFTGTTYQDMSNFIGKNLENVKNKKYQWVWYEEEEKYCNIGLTRINDNRERLGLPILENGK